MAVQANCRATVLMWVPPVLSLYGSALDFLTLVR